MGARSALIPYSRGHGPPPAAPRRARPDHQLPRIGGADHRSQPRRPSLRSATTRPDRRDHRHPSSGQTIRPADRGRLPALHRSGDHRYPSPAATRRRLFRSSPHPAGRIERGAGLRPQLPSRLATLLPFPGPAPRAARLRHLLHHL
ncbi:MAG: hypothetical protein EBZ36_17215 [Acidobacteria bacterium]|nr:hypothetical protein [Acidobacteriota bacterium]